ncbi:hypothetical protein ES705_30905 [subsurface metagenome]
MVKITNPLGDVKIGRQGEVVYQRKYGEQIRRQASPKRAIPSQAQIAHRNLYRAALTWRSNLSLANRRYLEGYCIANGVVDGYGVPLAWSRFALKIYLQAVKFVPDLELVQADPIPGEKKESNEVKVYWHFLHGQAKWCFQSFTPDEDFTIGKVILTLGRNNSPGTVIVEIRATDGAGKPTGPVLASGQTNGNTLPIYTATEWREIALSAYDLTEGTLYAIQTRAPGADGTNCLDWAASQYDTDYPDGRGGYSMNSGSTWAWLDRDQRFQVWSADTPGEKYKKGLLHVRHPALMKITHKRGELNVNGYDTLSSLDEEYLTGQVGLDVIEGDIIEATTLPDIEYAYPVR